MMFKEELKGKKVHLKDKNIDPTYGWPKIWNKENSYEIIDDTYTSNGHKYCVYIKNNRETWGVLFSELVLVGEYIQEEFEI